MGGRARSRGGRGAAGGPPHRTRLRLAAAEGGRTTILVREVRAIFWRARPLPAPLWHRRDDLWADVTDAIL